MPSAISYIRFSSDKQAKGSSVDRQQELIDSWLASHPDIPLNSDISVADLAKSGYTGAHLKQGLGTILTAIKVGIIQAGDYLLIERMDRLGRMKPIELQRLLIDLLESGIVLVTLHDNAEYTKERYNTDQSCIFILAGAIIQANQYSEALSERLKAAYKSKRIKAESGERIKRHNAYWLTSEGKLKEPEASIVRGCIGLYLSGSSYQGFIKVYPELKNKSASTHLRWFRNPAMIGHWQQRNNEVIENVFEALISPAVFQKLQDQIESNRISIPDERKTSLTSGLVKCGECGSSYLTRRKKSANGFIYINCCSTNNKKGKAFCANNSIWPASMLELIIKESFKSIHHLIKQPKLPSENETEIANLQARLNLKREQLNNIIDMIMNGAKGDQIIGKQNQLDDEVKQMESELFSIKERQRQQQTQQEELKALSNKFSEQKDKLFSDHAALRQLLMKIGFRITIQNKTAVVSIPDYNLNLTFEHCGRSTKYKCYFLLQRQLNNSVDYNHTVLSLDNETIAPDEMEMHNTEQHHFIEGRVRQHVLFKDHTDYADTDLNQPVHDWKELAKTLLE